MTPRTSSILAALLLLALGFGAAVTIVALSTWETRATSCPEDAYHSPGGLYGADYWFCWLPATRSPDGCHRNWRCTEDGCKRMADGVCVGKGWPGR